MNAIRALLPGCSEKLALALNVPESIPPPPVIYRNNTRYLDFRFLKFILIALVLLLLPIAQVRAETTSAGTYAKLVEAINAFNTNGEEDVINITSDITLTADLPAINSTITINGGGNTLDGNDLHRAISVTVGGSTLEINNLILTQMQSPPTGQFHGGAIDISPSSGGRATVTLNRVTVRDSEGWTSDNSVQGQGGGIYCSWVNLTINDSAIFNNRGYQGGGLSFGGSCTATINRSAIYNNTAGLNGGGIRISASNASATINNSTIYGNSSGTAAHYGGGIFISQGATARLNHVTITGNTPQGSAANSGGGIASRHANNKVHIRNSIIYGNSKGDCDKTANLLTNTGNIFGSLNNCGAGTGGVTVTSTPLAASPTTPSSATDPPPYYALPSGSPAINAVTCLPASVGGDEDQRGETRPRPAGGNCDIGAYEFPSTATTTTTTTSEDSGDTPPPANDEAPPPPPSDVDLPPGASGSSASGSSQKSGSWIPPTAMPRASTCLTLEGIWVDGIAQSTQCQRVSGYAIGNDEVAASAVDAVDVWGWVLPDMIVCFFASGGAFKFIDTGPIPRVVYDLRAYSQNGMTCAAIDRAGILVLLLGAAPPAAAAAPTQALSNCMVTTTAMLNFRDGPGGEVIGALPYNVTLTALEKSGGWFKVDYHGEQGWISADYVVPKGSCG